ncbi:MAG: ABC transporter permease [Bryobacterales bacterium]|nr:ABC transporter permease [Bryobacterales bacterium]
MTALQKMLFRDLAHMKGQVIAVSMVVACGVASYVSMRSTYRSLLLTQSSYYEAYRFADIFAHVKRAPDALAATMRQIPGVAALETRITMEVTLDVPGLAEPATGLLVSIPEHRRPILNDLHIRRGEYPQAGRSGEILASEAFAVANSLEVGSRIGAVINGRWKQLRISGIALSPEYIYEVRGGSILPDNKRFGVLWMPLPTLEAAFDMRGAFNDAALTLLRGTNPADVISRLDRLLAPYGSLGAYGRDEQISNRFISDEIAQNRVSSNVIPAIFLGVAAFLLHIVLTRLIQIQRKEIALLKAFGYSRGAIGAHYLKLSLLAVSGGIVLGVAAGLYFGSWVTQLYQQFYRFPVLRYEAGFGLVLTAIAISFAAAALGALMAVRSAMVLPPAEAMRPESPALFHAGVLEHTGVVRLLSFSGRMIIRNLNRRRGKAILSVLGIATAAGLMVVGFYFYDAFEYLMRVEFQVAERADVTVYFHEAKSEGARFEVARLPGVLYAEPFRSVPVRLRFGHRSKRSGILAMMPGSQLRRIINEEMRPVRLPEEGILLTEKLARDLGASPGDMLTVEVLEGRRPVRRIVVAGVTDELLGTSAYMSLDAIHRLMQEGGAVSGAWLEVDPAALPRLYSLLKRTPAVSAVAIRDAMLQTFRDIIAQSFTISTNILIVFAGIISFGMVYNGARIALSERGNEMASLRVLGFTQGEVARILLGEQALLTVVAIPLGCLLGYGICAFLSLRLSTELYRIPLIVTRQVYLFSAFVVLGSALLSGVLVARRLRRLDLMAVLKTRE